MKTALALITIIALIGVIVFQTEYQHPRHLAAMRVDYLAQIQRLDDNLDASLEERDHLAEQLDKAQRDLVDLATQLKAAQADLTEAKATPIPNPIPHPVNPIPNPVNPIPNPVNPTPNPVNPVSAELATLRAQLATAQAREKQVQSYDPGFDEQRVDPKTGKRSGIRTSDADRQKLEAQRTAELQRVGALIQTLQHRIAALESQLPQ